MKILDFVSKIFYVSSAFLNDIIHKCIYENYFVEKVDIKNLFLCSKQQAAIFVINNSKEVFYKKRNTIKYILEFIYTVYDFIVFQIATIVFIVKNIFVIIFRFRRV